MASAKLEFQGLQELYAALRALPAELADEGGKIVSDTAQETAAAIIAEYPSVTGNLKGGVKVVKEASGRWGTSVGVKSTAKTKDGRPLADMWETGTQTRQTALGYNRGAMWGGPKRGQHTVVKNAVPRRKQMIADLIALVERAGFRVSAE